MEKKTPEKPVPPSPVMAPPEQVLNYRAIAREYLQQYGANGLPPGGYTHLLERYNLWVSYFKPEKIRNTKLLVSDLKFENFQSNLRLNVDGKSIVNDVLEFLKHEGFTHTAVEEVKKYYSKQLNAERKNIVAFSKAAADAVCLLRALRKAQVEAPVDFMKDPYIEGKKREQEQAAERVGAILNNEGPKLKQEAKQQEEQRPPTLDCEEEAKDPYDDDVYMTPRTGMAETPARQSTPTTPEAAPKATPAKDPNELLMDNMTSLASLLKITPQELVNKILAPSPSPTPSPQAQVAQSFETPVARPPTPVQQVLQQGPRSQPIVGAHVQPQVHFQATPPIQFQYSPQGYPLQAQFPQQPVFQYQHQVPFHQQPIQPIVGNPVGQAPGVAPVYSYANTPFIAMDEVSEFDGTSPDPFLNKQWMEEFKELARCRQWSTKHACMKFPKKLTGRALRWFMSLPRHGKQDWKIIEAAFTEEFCDQKREVNRGALYYQATQKPNESVQEFLWRFCKLAPTELDIHRNQKHFKAHFELFASKLSDRTTCGRMHDRSPSSMKELNEIVREFERIEKLRTDVAKMSDRFRDSLKKKPTETSKTSTNGQAFGNKPHPQRNVNFNSKTKGEVHYTNANYDSTCDENTLDHEVDDQGLSSNDCSSDDWEDYQPDEESGVYEIHDKTGNNRAKTEAHRAKPTYRPGNQSPSANQLQCKACGDKGHQTSRCFKRCSICRTAHRIEDCPAMELIRALVKNQAEKAGGPQSPAQEQPLN